MENTRFKAIRSRTWVLTLVIVLSLCFYLLVNVGFGREINIVDFIVISAIQVVAHLTYYPDGENYGMMDALFMGNKKAYNDRANKINEEHKVAKLREFCKVEFEERKSEYKRIILGQLGLEEAELNYLSAQPQKALKRANKWEINGKIIYFPKWKRKKLIKFLFSPSPIKENNAETVMSATEINSTSALKDLTIKHKTQDYLFKFFKIFIWGGFLAYLTYSVKDGFGLADVVRMFTFLGSLITTAIVSYSSGERVIRLYKNQFYIDLSNFIDKFREWDK